MLFQGSTKTLAAVCGTGVTNGGTGTASFDTIGFSEAALDVFMGTADVVSNVPTVLKLAEGDTTSSYTDIPAFVGGGASGPALPTNVNTSNPSIYRFNIDLRQRKRYLKLSVSPQTTMLVFANMRLGRGASLPITAANAGVTQLTEG